MNSKLHISLLTGLLTLAFISITLAQDPPSPSKHYFRTLGWVGSFSDLYMSQELTKSEDGGVTVASADYHDTPISIINVGRSEMYPYQSDKPIYFLKHGDKGITVVGSVQIDKNISLALLLFSQVKGQNNLTIRSMADDNAGFPGGSYRCVNFSSQEVVANVSGVPGHIQKDQDSILKSHPMPGSNLVQFQLYLTNGTRVYSSLFPYSTLVRYLMFVVDDPNHPGSVMFLRLPDAASSATPPPPDPGT